MQNIRNVAIIAHVDHGKTTLVDALLRQSKTKLSKDLEGRGLIMDSNDLERERGITIFSKNASVQYGDTKINIIDTPGHADFSGEVERVLAMADGCLLLVDAKEGPMPQTRFVLKNALKMKLKIVVVINKIDKPHADPDNALNKIFDLFVELGADDATLDFPVVYAAAKLGKAGTTADLASMENIFPIFDAIMKYIPSPHGDSSKPLQLLVTNITGDDFKGRVATGRIANGVIQKGQDVVHINRTDIQKKYRVVSLMTFIGLERVDADMAEAGDIVALAGIPDVTIGETISDIANPKALPILLISEPTVRMTFMVNDSPFSGNEGTYTTSRQIRERLYKELENDMALKVEDNASGDWTVSGRGELHLSILIERLRREGYEFQVSKPQVIPKKIDGKTCVPFDRVYIETPENYSGAVIEKFGKRKGELKSMSQENGISFMEFVIPTRGLFGYRTEFLTDTKGLGIMHATFEGYFPDPGEWKERNQGSLIAHETGTTKQYGLANIQGRGVLFVGPGIEVYKGEVIGQNSHDGDLSVNVCKEKKLSNMRSKGDGESEHFNVPKTMDLEKSLSYISDDELVEVTPKSVRIRKIILDKLEQKRKDRGMI